MRIFNINNQNVIKKIGVNQILAVIFDNAANVKNAQKIIYEKYSKIENVQCIAHSINLITCDIAKENFSDYLLQQVNTLTTFFRNLHQANQKIVQLIKEKGIVSGELKLYCKTY